MKRLSNRESQEEVASVYVYLDPDTTRIYVTGSDGEEVKKFTREISSRARAYLYAKALYDAIVKYTGKRVASCIETPFKVSYSPNSFPDRESFPERITTAQITSTLRDDVCFEVQKGIPLNEAFRMIVNRYHLSSEDEQDIVRLIRQGG